MDNASIIKAILEFHTWHKSLPSLTDLTTLDYSLEHGHITVEEFEESERALKKQITLVADEFSKYEVFFDIDLPFYYHFLDRLKKFGESIDESKDHPKLSNPGFTKALISDVLKSISNQEQREREKIWIFLRCGDFLIESPELGNSN